MPDQYLHGAKVTQNDDGIRYLPTKKSNVILAVGTAPAADNDAFPVNEEVLVTGPRQAEALGTDGTLFDAYKAIYAEGMSVMIVKVVPEDADPAVQLANVIGDATAGTGILGAGQAQALTGQKPKILIAPGFTSPTTVGQRSPVTAALETMANQLGAVALIDGPNTNEADAITDRGLHGSDRLYMIDPHVQIFDQDEAAYVTRPGSAVAAGIIARTDREKGYWWSPSNQVARQVTGIARPIDFGINNPDTQANRLNEAGVATFIRRDGFRLWGIASTSSDRMWRQLQVRRTADMLYEAVEEGMMWAMDRPFSSQLILSIMNSVQAKIDELIQLGALIGGTVWLDPELNSATTLQEGKLYIDFDIEPAGALEQLKFTAYRNGSYYEELVAEVLDAA